jgi:hypothetical protein
MLGWIMIFTVMLLWGTVAAAMAEGTGQVTGLTSTFVFGFLLLVSGLTFTLRGRA